MFEHTCLCNATSIMPRKSEEDIFHVSCHSLSLHLVSVILFLTFFSGSSTSSFNKKFLIYKDMPLIFVLLLTVIEMLLRFVIIEFQNVMLNYIKRGMEQDAPTWHVSVFFRVYLGKLRGKNHSHFSIGRVKLSTLLL